MSAQGDWAQQSQLVWEAVGAEQLCCGPQAQAPAQQGSVRSRAVWVVQGQGSGAAMPWVGEGSPSSQWGLINAPYPGGRGAEWRNSPSSALTTSQTQESQGSLVSTPRILSSAGRTDGAPWRGRDLAGPGPCTQPKGLPVVAYRSTSSPAMCFQSSHCGSHRPLL